MFVSSLYYRSSSFLNLLSIAITIMTTFNIVVIALSLSELKEHLDNGLSLSFSSR